MTDQHQLELIPPHQRHSSESLAAAVAIKPAASALRDVVLGAIRAAGTRGATDDEIQAATGLDGSTQRPRRVELLRAGQIAAALGSRPTKSGRQAKVWVAIDRYTNTKEK